MAERISTLQVIWVGRMAAFDARRATFYGRRGSVYLTYVTKKNLMNDLTCFTQEDHSL
jgi:hypothetical protein